MQAGKCDADEFRKWHEERIQELYSNTPVIFELRQDREEFMSRAGWTCCKD